MTNQPTVIPCRICGASSQRVFELRIFDQHSAAYYFCERCGYTQTEQPTWLEEAYVEPVDRSDTGLLERNLDAQGIVATFCSLARIGDGLCVDFGGGYAVFTRLMRDAGFRFLHHDPLSENLLARGFEWESGEPVLCTAFEVLEHFVDPIVVFGEIDRMGVQFVIASTVVNQADGPPPPDWWYLAPQTGQHVGFFQERTLASLGRENGFPYVLTGGMYHLFSRRPFSRWRWWVALKLGPRLFRIGPRLFRAVSRRQSLVESDHIEQGGKGPTRTP